MVQEFKFDDPDGEALPLTQCACGHKYKSWTLVISVYASQPTTMPCCGRRVYFTQSIVVREVPAYTPSEACEHAEKSK